jgi:hypothetical protein
MNEGERAGRRALILLYIVLFAVWFNIMAIVGYHIKEWFL